MCIKSFQLSNPKSLSYNLRLLFECLVRVSINGQTHLLAILESRFVLHSISYTYLLLRFGNRQYYYDRCLFALVTISNQMKKMYKKKIKKRELILILDDPRCLSFLFNTQNTRWRWFLLLTLREYPPTLTDQRFAFEKTFLYFIVRTTICDCFAILSFRCLRCTIRCVVRSRGKIVQTISVKKKKKIEQPNKRDCTTV